MGKYGWCWLNFVKEGEEVLVDMTDEQKRVLSGKDAFGVSLSIERERVCFCIKRVRVSLCKRWTLYKSFQK